MKKKAFYKKQISCAIKKIFYFLFLCSTSSAVFSQVTDSSFGINGEQVVEYPKDYIITVKDAITQPDGKILVTMNREAISDYYSASQNLLRINPDGSSSVIAGVGGYRGLKIALQPDGKIVVAALYENGHRDYSRLSMFRLRVDGLTDTGFTIKDSFLDAYYVTSAGVQQDGKILVSGAFFYQNDDEGTRDRSMLRFLPDGTVDDSFGIGGGIPISSYSLGDFIVLPDDKFIGTTANAFVKYTAEGIIDSSFGVNGIVPITIGGRLLIQPDGKMLLRGYSSADPYFIYRYNADGSIDNSFGTGGKISIANYAPYYRDPMSMTLGTDGKIFISGPVPDTGFFNVLCLVGNGTIDSSFGVNGLLNVSFSDYGSEPGRYKTGFVRQPVLTIQPDGKLVVACSVNDNNAEDNETPEHLALARFGIDENNMHTITRIHFTAKAQTEKVLLKWQVSKQKNIVYYAVQRSDGNTAFKEIGKVRREGNTVTPYHFEDNAPLTGSNYYRIKLVRSDRTFTYSDTVAVSFSPAPAISITPNPVSNVLHIKGLDGNAANKLFIIRLGGSIAKSVTVVKQQSYGWYVQDLPNGVYTLVTESNGITTSVKFIKE